MWNFNKIYFLVYFYACSAFAIPPVQRDIKSENLNQFLNVRDTQHYIYPTKFGNLKFLRADGSLGLPSATITLGEKILLSAKNQVSAPGLDVSFMTEIMTSTSIETVRRKAGETGNIQTKRMIILIGEDGNCVKNFIILDFTGIKPFVSEQFAENPGNHFCLKFIKAKWGKKESEIILDGPADYIYYTNNKITGPFYDESQK